VKEALLLPSDCVDTRRVPVRQQALTVVAPIPTGASPSVSTLLTDKAADIRAALATVPGLHFARFVVLDGEAGGAPRLAFESNHDGDVAAHVASLAVALAPFDALLAQAWVGYRPGGLAAFASEHALPATTFYLGHPGLSVPQIQNDARVRERLESVTDDLSASGQLAGKAPAAARALILGALGHDGLVLGPVDRGLPKQPAAEEEFAVVVAVVVVLALFFLPASVFVEWREQKTEPTPDLLGDDDPRLGDLMAVEDPLGQNGLTHHSALRPGRFRKTALRVVLWFLEQARKRIAYSGTLGGISSIHFARWVLLDDATVLFFSNYDGSWESYLGDFVDKAHAYLSAVWSNTRWFPQTFAMITGGASREDTFKRWVRTFQVKNQVWYSAYPKLTVSNILANATIREGAVGPMSDAQARAWLALL
jgi:hypothetical protein